MSKISHISETHALIQVSTFPPQKIRDAWSQVTAIPQLLEKKEIPHGVSDGFIKKFCSFYERGKTRETHWRA